jgi:hypothetical protein
MSAAALFWIGFGLVVVAIVGFALALCRAAALADEDTQRALRQERAARAGLHSYTGNVQSSPQEPPCGDDAPRVLYISSRARGATTSPTTRGTT